jgi:proton-dependent oligopeptide transporter, POT family
MEEDERQPKNLAPSSSILWNRIVLAILITETAERVAYFGFRAVLVLYFTKVLRLSESKAVALCSATVALSYFSPLVGAVLADSYWGRFQTIWRFGCLYALGLCLLTGAAYTVPYHHNGNDASRDVEDNLTMGRTLTFLSLFLVCMGTGGIKPCVSAFGADQVVMDGDEEARVSGKKGHETLDDEAYHTIPGDDRRQERIREFFNSFYFAINLGALGSFALIPVVRANFGFGASFLIPTVSMILALIVFRAHKHEYKHRTRDESQHSLLEVFVVSIGILRDRLLDTAPVRSISFQCSAVWHHQVASADFDDESDTAEGSSRATVFYDASQALHLLPIMAFFPIFWMLYDQQGSVWTLQASRMNLHGLEPEQLQFLNPLEIMIFIPLFDRKIYPWLERRGFDVHPLRRMEYGMLLTAISFAISTVLELIIQDHGPLSVSVVWQVPQITVLTIAEILLNVTGLEFAYSQAPANMQTFILSLYLFMTAIGDGLGALLYGSIFEHLSSTTAMLLCAVFMIFNMFCFGLVARRWKPYYLTALDMQCLELGPFHMLEHQR